MNQKPEKEEYPGIKSKDKKITLGDSQMPIGEVVHNLLHDEGVSLQEIESDKQSYYLDKKGLSSFFQHLLSQPKDVNDLLLIVADNRRQNEKWMEDHKLKNRFLAQLRHLLRKNGPRSRRERPIPALAPQGEKEASRIVNLLQSDSAIDAAARSLWEADGYEHDGPDDDELHSKYFQQATLALSGLAEQMIHDLGLFDKVGTYKDEKGRIQVNPEKWRQYFN